jgi:DNA mismatch repair protein MSH4
MLALLTHYSVPATYASFPIFHQLFARLGMDDNIETNVSTFAAEMKEIAFILRNIDRRSLYVTINELLSLWLDSC